MFLFSKKKSKPPVGKPPLPPTGNIAPKVKTAEEAKREAMQNDKEKEKEKPKEKTKAEKEDLERVKDGEEVDEDEASRRRKASRRISQTQFGKPLSYNAYITQNKLNPTKPQ
jgi:hypothetical protein